MGVSADLQKKALQAEGCDFVYSGYSNDFDFERPELVKAVKHAEKMNRGCLVVFSLEQLAASLENLCDIFKVLRKLNISLICVKEGIRVSPYSNDNNRITESKHKVGYAHVNAEDSSCELQKNILQSEGCSKIYCGFSDRFDNERKELIRAVKYAEKVKAEFLMVCHIERLAGSLENLSDICRVLKKIGIPLICIEQDMIIIENTAGEILNSSKSEEQLETEKTGLEEIKLELAERRDNTSKRIDKKNTRRSILYLIRALIYLILVFGILGWIYYWLLTAYDKEEISESEYLAVKKGTR